MAQEIELKFIIMDNGVENLRHYLNTLDAQHTAASSLQNIYYDTAEGWLRSHDIGLRIRGERGQYEMTLKTAGHMTGGLHQRPEYNIPLQQPELALDRLPADVWPQGQLPATLAQNIRPLFSTDFSREKWQINEGASTIEIALDRGAVKTADRQQAICELELELLSGHLPDVLTLARRLLSVGVLRQGGLSKAARGYHLIQDKTKSLPKSLGILRLPAKATLEQGLVAALESALTHWLYHDEVWAQGYSAAKTEILQAIARVRYTLTLFGGVVPRKATAAIREQLNAAEAVLAAADTTSAALFSTVTVGAKLTLTAWLANREWRSFLDPQAQKQISGSFKRFADIHLSQALANLKKAFQPNSASHYHDQLPHLAREIGCIQLLASAYADAATPWLARWQALYRAIEHKNIPLIADFCHQVLAAEPFWLHSGKR